jgi:hypothetical protein
MYSKFQRRRYYFFPGILRLGMIYFARRVNLQGHFGLTDYFPFFSATAFNGITSFAQNIRDLKRPPVATSSLMT